jgi:beta-N-acetylhexosaminidase
MTLREKIGQLFIARVPQDYGYYIDGLHVGGFLLFKNDVESLGQVSALIADMRQKAEASGIPLFFGVDEEGGRVTRVGQLYDERIPSMLSIGKTGDVKNAYDAAFTIGGRLDNLGFNLNFAPVADVWSNPDNTVIGDRAFSTDADTAALMVEAAVKGFNDAGILSVVKHFPGHGDTAQDSHLEIAVYPYDRERFETVEALPFIRGVRAGADGVMVGHIATPQMQNEKAVCDFLQPWLDDERLPATFSDYWMQNVLRNELRYDGLIITDALDMGALTENFTAEQITLGAFMAGADVLLIPSDIPAAIGALTKAYDDGVFTDERLDASVRRILRAKLNKTDALDAILMRYQSKDGLTDWEAVALGINGVKTETSLNATSYFEETEKAVIERDGEQRLVTDYARVALAYRSHGKDTSDIAGYNFTEKIINFQNLDKQGLNAYTWALIALNGQRPEITQPLIENMLEYRTADNGFSFKRNPDDNVRADMDLTAMAVTALAPYAGKTEAALTDSVTVYADGFELEAASRADTSGVTVPLNDAAFVETVRAVVNEAVSCMINSQNKIDTCETAAQIIIALCSAGIEPDAKLIEIFDGYRLPGGFYTHTLELNKADDIATRQAALALTALKRFREGLGGIYE